MSSATVSARAEDFSHALALARQVLTIEAQAVAALTSRVDQRFIRALENILHCRGRTVVSGMGKSGHIARKIASTLASTGTPAFYMHPGEAAHGDAGMIAPQDVLIAISNSGESSELLTILPYLKRHGVKLIAMTGNGASTLAREADVHLDTSVAEEACPLGLAPTASTTATLALGDALALALLDLRGFSAEDFARTHPGGALGRRLLLHVADIMRTGDAIPRVLAEATLSQALLEMSRKGMGMVVITNEATELLGIFTDGDLRRALDRNLDIRNTAITTVMTAAPRAITSQKLAAEAVALMQHHKVYVLPVVDAAHKLVGALGMHDLLQAGVV